MTMILLVTTISLNSFPTMVSHQRVLSLALTVVLLTLPSLTCGEILHVRPTSTNTSCPTYPCQTLSEYAQDPGQYFKESNLTLLFLPGNHTLSVNLTITSVYHVEFLGNCSAVACSPFVGFSLMGISEVIIDGLAFVACARPGIVQDSYGKHFVTYYGLHLDSVQMAEIIDCTFWDSYGTALGVVDSHVVLRRNNSFLNNCRQCSNRRCDQYQSAHTCYGGGVFVHRSNLKFTVRTTFSGNSANDGGGISALSSNVDISGNTTFSRNSAGRYGGGISARYSSSVTISGNTIFSYNSASKDGGGVSAWNSSNVTISGNTTFSRNRATWGGGVNAWNSSNVTISGNTTFSRNVAWWYGGGVSAGGSTNVMISGNTTFNHNSAFWYGGGVNVQISSNVTICGTTTFSGNSVYSNDGGGIYASASSWFDCEA